MKAEHYVENNNSGFIGNDVTGFSYATTNPRELDSFHTNKETLD